MGVVDVDVCNDADDGYDNGKDFLLYDRALNTDICAAL